MFGEVYILILAAVIPFFSWQQREEGRNLVAMLITGVFLIMCLLTNTLPVVWDTTTICVLCFGLWMIASMFWSNSRQSSQDLYMMLCCLVVFLVARRMELNELLWMVFIPGLIFAAAQLYYFKSTDPKKKNFIFGNGNHIGAFLLCPLFAGAWLTFNVSWFLAPLVLVISVALALSKCRGAQVGVLLGLMYVACMQSLWMLALIPVILTAVWLVCRSRGTDFLNSTSGRISFILAALFLIRKSPMAGYGLRTFRREYPAIVPELLENKIAGTLFTKYAPKVESQSSHRIHNDHLEIIFELGLIGYIIFISIFSSLLWAASPLLAGAIVAFAVHGLFFFPFREAHTAFPFWALAGGMAGTSAVIMTMDPVIAGTLILIIGKILYEVAVKTLGLSYYDQAVKIAVSPQLIDDVGKEALKTKQTYINNAIKCDPYNNIYLTEGYYYNVFDNPEIAFQYASRCMENYDGGKVRWGVADQYARALLRLGGFGVAKSAVKYALHICPDFQQSIDLLKQIQEMEGQTKEPT